MQKPEFIGLGIKINILAAGVAASAELVTAYPNLRTSARDLVMVFFRAGFSDLNVITILGHFKRKTFCRTFKGHRAYCLISKAAHVSCNSVLTWLVEMCPLSQGDLGYNSEELLIPHDDDFKHVLWNMNTFGC